MNHGKAFSWTPNNNTAEKDENNMWSLSISKGKQSFYSSNKYILNITQTMQGCQE